MLNAAAASDAKMAPQRLISIVQEQHQIARARGELACFQEHREREQHEEEEDDEDDCCHHFDEDDEEECSMRKRLVEPDKELIEADEARAAKRGLFATALA